MKGITIDGEGLLDYAGTYKIRISMHGAEGEATINDNELGNVGNYAVELVDEAMIDYVQGYANLSSFLFLLIQARDDEEVALKEYLGRLYRNYKAKPAYHVLRDLENFGKSAKQAMLSDAHIKLLSDGDSKVIQHRANHAYYAHLCSRLERSIDILQKAWETARSLNSNNRKALGG